MLEQVCRGSQATRLLDPKMASSADDFPEFDVFMARRGAPPPPPGPPPAPAESSAPDEIRAWRAAAAERASRREAERARRAARERSELDRARARARALELELRARRDGAVTLQRWWRKREAAAKLLAALHELVTNARRVRRMSTAVVRLQCAARCALARRAALRRRGHTLGGRWTWAAVARVRALVRGWRVRRLLRFGKLVDMRAELVDALRFASSDRADASLSAADAALARAIGAQLPTLRGAWRSLVYDGTQRIGNDVDQHIARRGDDDSVSTQVALSLRRELRFSARSQRSPSQCSPPTKTAPSPLRRSSTTAANGSADRSSAASRPPPAPKRPPPPPPPPPSPPPSSDEAALATKRESGEITDRAGDDSGSAAEGSPRGSRSRSQHRERGARLREAERRLRRRHAMASSRSARLTAVSMRKALRGYLLDAHLILISPSRAGGQGARSSERSSW